MLGPSRLISIFRWTLFISMIAVSLFINRWLGFALLVSLVFWELSARYFAPYFLIKKLKKSRLRSHFIRQSMKQSLWIDHKGETELLELSADWPMALLVYQKNPTLIFNRILASKLNPSEMIILLDWMYLLYKRQLSFVSLQLILLTAPLTFIFKILDKMGLSSAKPGVLTWEGSFHKMISPLLRPLFAEYETLILELKKHHHPTHVDRLRDKLNHLIRAHDLWPPADIIYLYVDPRYFFKKQSYYYFTENPKPSLKETAYGTQS